MTQGFTRMVVGALLLAGGLPAFAQSKMVTLAEVAQGEAGASIWVSGTVARFVPSQRMRRPAS